MRKNLILIIFVFIISMILSTGFVNAVSAEISATAYDVKVGDKVTININFTAAAWNITVSGNGITGASYASQTEDLTEKTTSKSFELDTSKAGTYTIKMTGDITNENGGTNKVDKSITIKVANVETTTPEQPVTPPATTKSSEARLRDLGITPNDFKGFKRDTTTYNLEVPNSVSKVNVYAKALDSNAKINGTGNVTLKEGENTVKVVVTAEDGKTTKTYTLNITRKTADEETGELENESSEARLKNLGIKPKEYDFSGFKKDTTTYTVEVPKDVEEIEVYAEAVSSKAKISGTGKVELKEGKNTINVEVTAEDGTKKTYTLEITRKEAEIAGTTEEPKDKNESGKFGLTSLTIKDVEMSPKFDPETYEYTVGLTKDLSSLEINTKTGDSDTKVEIIGNENLKEGENIITILVSNEETEEVVTYQIVVNKNVKIEEAKKAEWLKPSTWGKEQKIIIAVVVALVVLIIIAIVLKIKISREDYEDDDLDLPGGEELDKALAEHQELTEDTEEIENIRNFENYEDAEKDKSDIEKAQEYFEEYSKRRGKHF